MKLRILLILLALLLISPAQAAYWEDSPDLPVVCREDDSGCQILQMVMRGSFDFFDPADLLSGRVLSAALDSLCVVDDEDFAHFVDMFGVEEAVIRRYYYIALANCLWADIVTGSDPVSNEEHVLLLFLDPSTEENAQTQMDTIRSRMSDDSIDALAQAVGVPSDFVYYLIYSESWHDLDAGVF